MSMVQGHLPCSPTCCNVSGPQAELSKFGRDTLTYLNLSCECWYIVLRDQCSNPSKFPPISQFEYLEIWQLQIIALFFGPYFFFLHSIVSPKPFHFHDVIEAERSIFNWWSWCWLSWRWLSWWWLSWWWLSRYIIASSTNSSMHWQFIGPTLWHTSTGMIKPSISLYQQKHLCCYFLI